MYSLYLSKARFRLRWYFAKKQQKKKSKKGIKGMRNCAKQKANGTHLILSGRLVPTAWKEKIEFIIGCIWVTCYFTRQQRMEKSNQLRW